ncbi:MAG: hypothetical protein J5623_07285 [Clostridiales bacterium]|nr:hypothetical protein [Clostridiales bacterium]
MTTLSIDADISAGTDLLGKHVSDLQSGVIIGDSQIVGTLKYLSDYTGFSGDPNEQKGNYIALHCTSSETVDSLSVEVINGTVGHPVTLDGDGIAVLKIADKVRQKIRFAAHKDDQTVTKTFDLSGLTLESEV